MAEQLIPKDEMTKLIPASQAKAIADKALELHNEAVAAYLINDAVNNGQHSVLWQHTMTDALKTVLEGQGYKITRRRHAANPDVVFVIEGF